MYKNVLITEGKHSEGREGDSSLPVSLYFKAPNGNRDKYYYGKSFQETVSDSIRSVRHILLSQGNVPGGSELPSQQGLSWTCQTDSGVAQKKDPLC